MGEHVTDDMFDEYAVSGTPTEVVRKLEARFGGITQRIQLDEEWFDGLSDDEIRSLVKSIQAIG